MLASTVMGFRHRFGPPCTECVRAMPLNPAELAWEHRRTRGVLWAFHTTSESPARLLLFCTLHFAVILLGFGPLYGWVGIPGAAGPANAFFALGLVLTMAMHWATRTHNRFAPWCPYCDDAPPVPHPTDDHPVPA
ncbi:hypothetical protein OOK31_37175 [Streptomyces sp. NBC_00249]|uniref:hypothetical protein n=1 Tax=Streptomyces sp. NBC_00249 TaxID=2975690 RepID=UPI002256B182|nr:hypothetical protein [Streptomyces sp. NBC_00249]MCX5199444.1 hypothetical protein [Streptomyces sp. NBC_00249]